MRPSLAYPLDVITDEKQIKKDLDYYTERLSPDGPAMGAAILAILNQRLGEPEKAASIFLDSYKKMKCLLLELLPKQRVEPTPILPQGPEACFRPFWRDSAAFTSPTTASNKGITSFPSHGKS